MSWLKKVFSSQSSQETQVVNEKTKEDKKEDGPQIENLNIEEEAEKESSEGCQDSWFSFWSGLSTTFNLSKKRELSDDEEEKKAKNGGAHSVVKKKQTESVFSTQTSSSSSQLFSLSPMQTCVDKDDSWDHNESKKDNKKEENDNDMTMQKLNFLLK